MKGRTKTNLKAIIRYIMIFIMTGMILQIKCVLLSFLEFRFILTAAHCLCNEYFSCKSSHLNKQGLVIDYDPLGKILIHLGLTGRQSTQAKGDNNVYHVSNSI